MSQGGPHKPELNQVTSSSMSPGPILYTWVEKDNVEKGFLFKKTTRWQGLSNEPPTFRSEVKPLHHRTPTTQVLPMHGMKSMT